MITQDNKGKGLKRPSMNYHANFVIMNNKFESLGARMQRERKHRELMAQLENEMLKKFKK